MYVQVLQNIRGVIKTGALTHFVFIDSNNSAFEFFFWGGAPIFAPLICIFHRENVDIL